MRAAPSRPLRILVNAIHARAGGGLTYLRHLLPLLAREEGISLALIPHPSQRSSFAALLPDLTIHDLPMPRGWMGLLLWEQLVLPFKAARLGYDVMLSPANYGPLAIRRQLLVVQNALGVGKYEHRLGMKLYWAVLRWMTILSLRRADAAIAVSRYAAESAASRLLPHPPPVIIPHGVGTEFQPAPVPRENFLLAVGDLYIQKNLHHLIEAFALVRRAVPEISLRIAGTAIDQAHAAGLRRQVDTLGLADVVHFLGRVTQSELVALYQRCAVFVFPSVEESFGMPLIEAMACGAPVVASRAAAMPEIAGEGALLCEPAQPSVLAAAILKLLGDAAQRQALQQRGIERASHFSWPDCATRTAALLRRIATPAGRPARDALSMPL